MYRYLYVKYISYMCRQLLIKLLKNSFTVCKIRIEKRFKALKILVSFYIIIFYILFVISVITHNLLNITIQYNKINWED